MFWFDLGTLNTFCTLKESKLYLRFINEVKYIPPGYLYDIFVGGGYIIIEWDGGCAKIWWKWLDSKKLFWGSFSGDVKIVAD